MPFPERSFTRANSLAFCNWPASSNGVNIKGSPTSSLVKFGCDADPGNMLKKGPFRVLSIGCKIVRFFAAAKTEERLFWSKIRLRVMNLSKIFQSIFRMQDPYCIRIVNMRIKCSVFIFFEGLKNIKCLQTLDSFFSDAEKYPMNRIVRKKNPYVINALFETTGKLKFATLYIKLTFSLFFQS